MSSIYEQWGEHQAANIEPENSEAIVVPNLIMNAHGIPEHLRDAVERVWDEAFKVAIRYAEHVAQHPQNPGQQ